MISLQNAPPTSHGTPAPTKEDGEIGRAGFRVHAWIPMDEDEDVTDEMLQEEVDWWSKPGAPVRPELRTAKPSSVTVGEDIQKGDDDIMQIDRPNEAPMMTTMTTTRSADGTNAPAPVRSPVGILAKSTSPAVLSPAVISPAMASPKALPLPPQIDTEMTDAPLSPAPAFSTLLSSPPTFQAKSPTPVPQTTSPAKSPAKSSKLAPMEDLLDNSKASPPYDPFTQADEIAAVPAMEMATEQVELSTDIENSSGIGDEIVSQGIFGGGAVDLGDAQEEAKRAVGERTSKEEELMEETKENLDTEVVMDDAHEELRLSPGGFGYSTGEGESHS